MDKVLLGETRRDAINALQERLGPATLRHIAEKTFWSLARQHKITMNGEGHYLIEAEADEVREAGEQTVKQAQSEERRNQTVRSRSRQFSLQRFHQARISSHMRAVNSNMKSSFAPSLSGAEGFKGAGDVPDDE